jgi:nitric oxide reductase NorQ protein
LACNVGLVSPLSDDPNLIAAMHDLIDAVLVD